MNAKKSSTAIPLFPFLICLLFACVACSKNNCRENIKDICACTKQYDPVCGCNDKTYGNACEAECSGIKDFKAGECK